MALSILRPANINSSDITGGLVLGGKNKSKKSKKRGGMPVLGGVPIVMGRAGGKTKKNKSKKNKSRKSSKK
jgi:uncharacterized membrane protein